MAKAGTVLTRETALSTNSGANVAFRRKELREIQQDYEMIDDAVAGARIVKQKGPKYLPRPNAADGSEENLARYEAYRTRAVFYGVTSRTLEGFMGELFSKDPVVTVPTALDSVVEDANGEGVSLVQLSKDVSRQVISKGRAGIFVDYPNTGGVITQVQKDASGVRPVIRMYKPLDIINWRTKKVGALTVLALIVLEEIVENNNDDFTDVSKKQWRVLRLDEANRYTVQVYMGTTAADAVAADPITPTNSTGATFDRIPFMFVGANSNDSTVDKPPMYDLADLNIAHYRNSADYEEACFICGQPTPVVTGLTETWVDKYFKNGVGLGSRAALPLPAGATAELLQALPNTMPKEAMEHKERQMVAVGAKLVEQSTVQRTATEAGQEAASEQSTLANIADNISLAFEWALGFAAEWEGVGESLVTYRVNKEFSTAFGNPEARAEAIKAWQAEAITFTEMRSALRKGGTATLPDDQARAEMAKDQASGFGPASQMVEFDDDGNPIPPKPPGGILPENTPPAPPPADDE